MNEFIADFSKPIERNKINHIEYIPTQVITEYLRYFFLYKDHPVDGILFYSSQNRGKCCVLFVKNDHCIEKLKSDVNGDELFLILSKYNINKI